MADLQVTLNTDGLERILREMPGKVETFLDGFAEDMVTQIKLSFGTSPPGASYQRGGVTHVASSLGFPPNVDSDALRESITQEPTGQFERTISDGTDYGADLEDGTEHIDPRPFMRPVFDDAQRRIEGEAARDLKLE